MRSGIAVLGIALAASAEQEPKPVAPAFEVASVKIATEQSRVPTFCAVPCFGEHMSLTGSRVDIRYMPLHVMIATAYRIKPYQLSGPDWMRSQRFDIGATIPAGVSKDRVPEMLQALLVDRFKLSFHRESKEQPVYALVVGKNGSKLQSPRAEAEAPAPETSGSPPVSTSQGDRLLPGGGFAVNSGLYGPIRGGRGAGGGLKMEFLRVTMPALVEVLLPHLERPVVDMTNLQGGYYLAVDIRMPSGEGGARKGAPAQGPRDQGDGLDSGRPPDAYGQALFAAIEKAGLKLESRKAPVEVIVVDRLEKTPTEN